MTRAAFIITPHVIARNGLVLHRKVIVENLRKLPDCDQVRGLALRSN